MAAKGAEAVTEKRSTKMDPEIVAMGRITRILAALGPGAQARVMRWATDRVNDLPRQQPLPFEASKPE